MSERLVRVALVGVGGMGLAHLRAVRASRRASLVALCDLSEPALEAACDGQRLPCFRTPEELFQAGGFDALICVLPHDLYPPVIELAARHGVAVLKEKPFARNLADGQRMHHAVTGSRIPFLCAAQRQYSKPFQAARELLDSGAVGEVFMTQGLITYPWRLDGGWGWRGERIRSGGIALVDSGWHILDAMAWLKGLPSSVYCRIGSRRAVGGDYDVDDKAIATFDFPDGSIGSVTACFVTVPSRFELVLHGTEGALELTQDRLTLYPRRGGAPEVIDDDGRDLMAAQFEHFLDVILEGVAPRVGIDDALHLQRVVEAAYESAATDRAVELVW